MLVFKDILDELSSVLKRILAVALLYSEILSLYHELFTALTFNGRVIIT